MQLPVPVVKLFQSVGQCACACCCVSSAYWKGLITRCHSNELGSCLPIYPLLFASCFKFSSLPMEFASCVGTLCGLNWPGTKLICGVIRWTSQVLLKKSQYKSIKWNVSFQKPIETFLNTFLWRCSWAAPSDWILVVCLVLLTLWFNLRGCLWGCFAQHCVIWKVHLPLWVLNHSSICFLFLHTVNKKRKKKI